MANKELSNFVLDRVFISEKGNLCWTKATITPDGEKGEVEWVMYLPAGDPQMDAAVKWLKSIGRL